MKNIANFAVLIRSIMTITLVVLLIITLAALIFLPFSKALMKDRQELESNPMEQKFNILISRINKLLMGGAGEVIKTSDPRQMNLFDENHANMIIRFYYSTDSLSIELKYKYYQVELVKKMQFDDMRHAESFRQTDVANHFAEEAHAAIIDHQAKVGSQMGMKNPVGDFIFSKSETESDDSDGIGMIRKMYDDFSHQQKVALVNLVRQVYSTDNSETTFRNHPMLSNTLLSLQVNLSEADSAWTSSGRQGIISALQKDEDGKLPIILTVIFPFLQGMTERRAEAFMEIMSACGYPEDEVNQEAEKMILMMQMFSPS